MTSSKYGNTPVICLICNILSAVNCFCNSASCTPVIKLRFSYGAIQNQRSAESFNDESLCRLYEVGRLKDEEDDQVSIISCPSFMTE